MAMARVAYALWQHHLRFDPEDPIWPGRDRSVLSAGHASMLLYSMLHLAGVKAVDPKYEVVGDEAVAMKDIESFRQLDSRCPGHPAYRWTSGVAATPRPLGGSPPRSARRSPRSGCTPPTTAPTPTSSTPTPTRWPATAA